MTDAVPICPDCGYADHEDRRVGTSESNVNVWAPPFCDTCKRNMWGLKIESLKSERQLREEIGLPKR